MKPSIVIVSPALADANNGNWQTARRWQGMLQAQAAVRIVREWPDALAATGAVTDSAMLALHARRSAASIAAWAQARSVSSNAPGLAVVLTGTDLYRDIHTDAASQRSLELAQHLVLLQECAPAGLPAHLRSKALVIFQSTSARHILVKSPKQFRALMVGHLRAEKSPQTLFAAAHLLSAELGIWIDHIGAPLDAALGAQAQATALACPQYRWLGAQAHEATRKRIQRAHVLVHCSAMEGGAHVLMEAVRCGTPVLCSRVDGNVGMLGADYAGYFAWNDAAQLAHLLQRCAKRADPLYAQLQAQCRLRAPLFAPASEQAALQKLQRALHATPGSNPI